MDSPSFLLLSNSWRISGFRNRSLPPWVFFGKKGLLPLSTISLLHCCSITFQWEQPTPLSQKGTLSPGSGIQEIANMSHCPQQSSIAVRVVLLCISYFFLELCQYRQGFLVLLFEFQVKWNNSSITLRSQYIFLNVNLHYFEKHHQ